MALCDKQRENDWKAEFDRWVEPFLDEFEEDSQQRWCPVYLRGLLAPGERKSIEPMAAPAVRVHVPWLQRPTRITMVTLAKVFNAKPPSGYKRLKDACSGRRCSSSCALSDEPSGQGRSTISLFSVDNDTPAGVYSMLALSIHFISRPIRRLGPEEYDHA